MAGKPGVRSVSSHVGTSASQLFRYALAGALINLAGYLLYLWLTFMDIDPKTAASICFVGGVILGFVVNRKWTFRDTGGFRGAFSRYTLAYAIAYVVNIGGLYVFVDMVRYPHEIVQLGLILSIACGLFVAQKFWIFSGLRGTEPNQ